MNAAQSPPQLAAVAEILLGMAYADGRFEVAEAYQIRQILSEVMRIGDLPALVVERIHAFDEASYSLEDAVGRLGALDAPDRRELLEMLLRVVDADAVRDRDEQHYFYTVVRAIGAQLDEYSDLLLREV